MKHDPDIIKAALQALYRTSLPSFYRRSVEELFPGREYHDAAYLDAIFYQLSLVETGDVSRLIVNIPPRHFKSTIVSVVMVAYLLGIDPSLKIVVVSYSKDLAAELQNQTRDLMASDFYTGVFPKTTIREGKNNETQFKTTMNGSRRAVSTGSSITGFGADLIICDDMMKPEEALSDVQREKTNNYLKNTLLSRFEDKKYGAMILVQQRLHPYDTTGMLLESGDWQHLKLSAIATTKEAIPIGDGEYFCRMPGKALDPEREDLETLEKIRHEVGTQNFSAQWQQEPVLPGGNLFKLEQFKRYEELPPRHRIDHLVQSWDPAVTAADTSDYSVCTTWAVQGKYYFLVDVFRMKLDFADLEKMVRIQAEKYLPKLVIFEASHDGHALYSKYYGSDLCHAIGGGPILFKTLTPKKSKVERAAVEAVAIEQGRVYLPVAADWLKPLETELCQFPNSKYDDQVDSMVQFLHAMKFDIPGYNW